MFLTWIKQAVSVSLISPNKYQAEDIIYCPVKFVSTIKSFFYTIKLI